MSHDMSHIEMAKAAATETIARELFLKSNGEESPETCYYKSQAFVSYAVQYLDGLQTSKEPPDEEGGVVD